MLLKMHRASKMNDGISQRKDDVHGKCRQEGGHKSGKYTVLTKVQYGLCTGKGDEACKKMNVPVVFLVTTYFLFLLGQFFKHCFCRLVQSDTRHGCCHGRNGRSEPERSVHVGGNK